MPYKDPEQEKQWRSERQVFYRDADGLRAAMRRCKSWRAAKVLANEYRRACARYPSSLQDPLWLQVEMDLKERKLWQPKS